MENKNFLLEFENKIKSFSETKVIEIHYEFENKRDLAIALQIYGEGLIDSFLLLKKTEDNIGEKFLRNILYNEIKKIDLPYFHEIIRNNIGNLIDDSINSNEFLISKECCFFDIVCHVSDIKYYRHLKTSDLWLEHNQKFLSFKEEYPNKRFGLTRFIEITNILFNSLEKEIFLLTNDELNKLLFNDPLDDFHEVSIYLFLRFISTKYKEMNLEVNFVFDELRNPINLLSPRK